MLEANNIAKEEMENGIKHLKNQLAKIRTGRANASMFDSVRVDYYGSMTPLAQTSAISVPEPRMIIIKPYDKTLVEEICRAITNSGLGLNPQNEGDKVRIAVPQLTEEVRKRLVKDLGKYEEEAKVIVRNGRKNANDVIKSKEDLSEDAARVAKDEVQKIHDDYIKQVEDIVKEKAENLMRI